MAHMGNMSMNPLDAPLILILTIGCDVKLGMSRKTLLWSWLTFFQNVRKSLVKHLRKPIMQEPFYSKLMGNVSKMLFKAVDGLHCPEKYHPLALRLLEASKMSQNHFPLCSGSEVPWKLPQIFMSDKH